MAEQARANDVVWWGGRNAHALGLIVDEILREEAWWIAVRTGKFAYGSTVWVDRDRGAEAAAGDWPRPAPWRGDTLDKRGDP